MKVSNSYTKIETKYNVEIFLPAQKLDLLNNKNINIDLENFLFIKKLILKNLEIIMI